MKDKLELVIGTKFAQLDLELAKTEDVFATAGAKAFTKDIDKFILDKIEATLEKDDNWNYNTKKDVYKWYKYNGIYSKKNAVPERESLLDVIYKYKDEII
jgi:hypothetical protein